MRLQLVGLDVGGHIFLEQTAELGNVLFLEREAHGVCMAAEILEQMARGIDRRVDVEPLYRAAGAGGQAVAECQHHGGLVVKLGDARGHDADYALVPVLVVDDDGALAAGDVHILLDLRVGFLGHLLVQLLAVAVVLVDVLALLVRLVQIAAHQ